MQMPPDLKHVNVVLHARLSQIAARTAQMTCMQVARSPEVTVTVHADVSWSYTHK